jgi:type III secretion protein S
MNSDIVNMTIEAMWLMLLLSAPPVIAASVVGLIVAIIQSATQLQEQTLQYTLKFLAIVVAIFLTAGLVASSLINYTDAIFTGFPGMFR